MFFALRYYWIVAKGHRLRPWRSPYLRWRMETFFGTQKNDGSAGEFIHLMWRERERMARFLQWAHERQREQSQRS
jgi:hypothetical protein